MTARENDQDGNNPEIEVVLMKPKRAKAMDVYGKPPADIMGRLTKRQLGELDRYVGRVASQVYRTAFDCGQQYMLRKTTEFLAKGIR